MESIILIVLALIGLVAHYLKKLIEARNATGQIVSPKSYYLANPYTSLSSLMLCAGGMLMLWGSEELTRVTAFGLGYMADSMISMIMRRKSQS